MFTDKKILLAILVRNKGHILEKYLECIENLKWNKKLIQIYINTNNNSDNTEDILNNWVDQNNDKYMGIDYEKHNRIELQNTNTDPHDWNSNRFKVLGEIRNKSMLKTFEYNCDYYFVVDCDNLIIPETLKDLVEKDKPIIGPLLRTIPNKNLVYSNYFYDIYDDGYYKSHPDYFKILNREIIGVFEVPVIHCTYLIKQEYIDKLNYIDDTTNHEFIIFSRTARKHNIGQYLLNEKQYGVLIYFSNNVTLEEEKQQIDKYFLENNNTIF